MEATGARHRMAAAMVSRELEGSSAAHAQVSQLASAIITDQTREIARRQRWLRAWFGAAGMGMWTLR